MYPRTSALVGIAVSLLGVLAVIAYLLLTGGAR